MSYQGELADVLRELRLGPRPRAFRKPLAKDAHKTLMATKPWEAEGISRRTWYRQKDSS